MNVAPDPGLELLIFMSVDPALEFSFSLLRFQLRVLFVFTQ